MKNHTLLFLISLCAISGYSQTSDELESTKNIGFGINYYNGPFYTDNTSFLSLKLPYGFSGKFEGGVFFTGFYSPTDIAVVPKVKTVFGAFGGVYIQPKLFNFGSVNIFMPIKLGFGSIGYALQSTSDIIDDDIAKVEDWDPLFITTFGINTAFKLSKNSSLEIEVNYRSSGSIELIPNYTNNISAVTFGIGFKTYILNI